jgi:hypothetical protein
MNLFNYVVCSHIQVLMGQQAYLTRQIVLNSICFDTQRPNRRSMEIWFRMKRLNNETVHQVSERNRF